MGDIRDSFVDERRSGLMTGPDYDTNPDSDFAPPHVRAARKESAAAGGRQPQGTPHDPRVGDNAPKTWPWSGPGNELPEETPPQTAAPQTAADPRQNDHRQRAQDGGGLRYADGKCRVELIPPEWPWALGMVLTRGAIKYADRNWERGMAWSYMIGSTLRHVFKFICGERYDKESGNHHLAHAAWNCLALMSYDIRGSIGTNDLPMCSLAPLPTPLPGKDLLELTCTEMGPELLAKAIAKQNLPRR